MILRAERDSVSAVLNMKTLIETGSYQLFNKAPTD